MRVCDRSVTVSSFQGAILDGKYSERVQIPSKAIAEFFDRYVTLPFADMIQRASVKCKQPPVYGVFLYCYFHIPLPIVTKHELDLPLPPTNIPVKFGTNPSTIFLVIVVTDRHTDTHTNQRR